MRRFFTVLFILSLTATAATLYWRTYLPEEAPVASAPAPKSEGPAASSRSVRPGSPDARPYTQEAAKEPSARQDYAVTISIVSSIISAVAAMLQTWLTARAYKR